MMNVRWKVVAVWGGVAIIVAAVIYGIVVFTTPTGTSGVATSTSSASTTVTNGAPGGTGSSTASAAPAPSKAGGKGSGNIPALPGPAITIHLLTPISGNVWTPGGNNSIAWDNPAGTTGEIDLVTANTKTFVGVILSETGPNQTSYSWDARSIYLARYSADKKDVIPGIYSIRIHFDGNGLGDLVSGSITITN